LAAQAVLSDCGRLFMEPKGLHEHALRRPPSYYFFALVELSGCSANPLTISDFKHYTGIALCPAARFRDVTTPEERDTTPGFSFHVKLGLSPKCAKDFERQLAALSPPECASNLLRPDGCHVEDAYAVAGVHTSIIARPIATGEYDVRFWE
jgi:hypothetical protein